MSDHRDSWQPSASIRTLKRRAEFIAKIRRYFTERNCWEVDTPVLSRFGGTDVQLIQWQTSEGFKLQTSPEFCMKRLLASGSGDIFQIAHAFRKDEQGQRHNPEFCLLEWYRVGFDEFALMADVRSLIETINGKGCLEETRLTYREAFIRSELPCPLSADIEKIRQVVNQRCQADAANWTRDECLDALMALVVEPGLPKDQLTFVYNYPASQAALAEFGEEIGVTVGRRFELYWQGMELANGYFELIDVDEQSRRFEQEQQQRRQQGLPDASADPWLLEALKSGMPSCAGVALGLDRLVMILLNAERIEQVQAFSFDRV